MQSQLDTLTQQALDKLTTTPPTHRLLISICGLPGSGKTTLARTIASRLNTLLPSSPALMIPMDGYHLTRAELSAMPDPALAHYSRGAHWTFSPSKFAALLSLCRAPVDATTAAILAPSFDHKVKDPVEGDIRIEPRHRVLVFEGNYVNLRQPEEWAEVSKAFEEGLRWWVKVDEEVARERLAGRHVLAGICGTLEEGRERAEGNDIPNGRWAVENMGDVDFVVESLEDGSFARGEE